MPRENRYGAHVAGHLGGYIPEGDVNTYYPALWEWLVCEQGISSVLDVGCGDGTGSLSYFRTLGCHVLGIEGMDDVTDPDIVRHDFTTGPWPVKGNRIEGAYDLVWSCEFVEHVEEQYVPNFLDTFTAAPLVLMTHALPGQGGHHHVNCQDDAYWITRLADIGYRLDWKLTERCRALARQEDISVEQNYFFRSGLAFVPCPTDRPGVDLGGQIWIDGRT